jgi:hypothetical protein
MGEDMCAVILDSSDGPERFHENVFAVTGAESMHVVLDTMDVISRVTWTFFTSIQMVIGGQYEFPDNQQSL